MKSDLRLFDCYSNSGYNKTVCERENLLSSQVFHGRLPATYNCFQSHQSQRSIEHTKSIESKKPKSFEFTQ